MEVVSTSNLDSSKTEKNSNRLIFNMIMPWEANMNMKQKMYKYEAIRCFMIAEMWKSTLRNIYRKQQNQNQPAIS